MSELNEPNQSNSPKAPVPIEPQLPGEDAASIGVLRLIRNRVIAGLFVVLPLFITYVVIRWLYDTLYAFALKPIAVMLKETWGFEDAAPSTLLDFLLSLAALGMVLGILFVAGMFFRSRLHTAVDWIMLNVPGVRTVYSAVSKVFNALSTTGDREKFKRVVLVEFPHSGMKAPAFVTGECQDISTGEKILCVYVPTTPVPTSGYMLLVPAHKVVDLNWDLEEALQAIVSGGITVPATVSYHAEVKPTAH